MSPLASCEVGMGAGAHNAEVVGGDVVVHGVVGESGYGRLWIFHWQGG